MSKRRITVRRVNEKIQMNIARAHLVTDKCWVCTQVISGSKQQQCCHTVYSSVEKALSVALPQRLQSNIWQCCKYAADIGA